ncbi:coiled-coil-helix-coiled-coil-helix domain-containing protein 1 [Melanotaenia boesemani]|uniref:coiled-coil-helix-coiled-coil-helix domain-containing protein 1 n=1 Tax=Melanotaenia boesemani TaxID=1250792 RepID=UPI001C04BD7A|nr:coiled-coil-helix-coiled-coil-helix domain-containing protein 1 [Melanotaenia boesemani]
MAAQGGVVFQEKVSRLLSKSNGKPVLKPNKTLALRDAVANRKLNKGEASCITEISILMACWKKNNFVDGLCSTEIDSFYVCVEKARAALKNTSEQSSAGRRMPPKQAITLLKRFPNLRTEV